MIFDTFLQLRGFSEQQFAAQADITPATLAAWRTGTSAPTTAELIEIATRFHTTVADLLGNAVLDTLPDRVPGIEAIFDRDSLTPETSLKWWTARRHAYFGLIGVRLPGSTVERFFPVDAAQHAALLTPSQPIPAGGLVPIKTRNGRVLAIRRIDLPLSFTEHGAWPDDEEPALDWDGTGLPPEVYRGMAAFAEGKGGSTDWSPAMQAQIAAALDRLGSRDPQIIREAIATTLVHHLDGRITRLQAEPRQLHAAVRMIELGALTVFLSDIDTGIDHLIALDGVAMLDMPLYQVETMPGG